LNEINFDHLKKLWILDVVIKCRSLKKASLELRVSPIAVSQAMTNLEKSLGHRLLVRGHGSIKATPEALELLRLVAPAFQIFSNLKNFGATQAPKISWLKFGTYESIAIDLLPGLIDSLRAQLPNLRLGLRISRTPNLVSMVRNGELCSALIPETDDLSRLYVNEVGEDQLGFFVSRSRAVPETNFSIIKKIGWGSLAPGANGSPRYLTKFLRQFDLTKPMVSSDSFEVLRAAASAGALVALLPKRVALRYNDLVEISNSKKNKESGQHRLLVVSQSSCDKQETDFIADEARRLLKMT
jgi:DNA-binding transcriptional LysR family regulator